MIQSGPRTTGMLEAVWRAPTASAFFYVALSLHWQKKTLLRMLHLSCIMSLGSPRERDPKGLRITSSQPATDTFLQMQQCAFVGRRTWWRACSYLLHSSICSAGLISCDLMQLKTPLHLMQTHTRSHTH